MVLKTQGKPRVATFGAQVPLANFYRLFVSILSSSCKTYRQTAGKLYAPQHLLIFSILLSSYSSAVSLSRLGSVWRLKGPRDPLPQLKIVQTKTQGEGCLEKPTEDLVLAVAGDASSWMDGLSQALTAEEKKSGLCRVFAVPNENGLTEIRFSYFLKPKQKLRTLTFLTDTSFVVDYWFESRRPVKSDADASSKKEDSAALVSTEISLVNGEQIQTVDLNKLEAAAANFENTDSWEAILGLSAQAIDTSSKEMDRFRSKKEKNIGIPTEPFEKQPLRLPVLELGSQDKPVEFQQKKMDWELFHDFPSNPGKSRKNKRAYDAVLKGMNFVVLMAKKGDWVKAIHGLDVLSKSEFASYVPLFEPRWWAIKGFIKLELGKELKNKAMILQGFGEWREGLQRTALRSTASREAIEYMALELVRRLLIDKYSYAAATFLTWTMQYTWTAEALERFAYLRAEAFYDIGFYGEAYKVFEEFLENRRNAQVSSLVDRRLVPAAAFRLGDCQFKMGKFEEAIVEYSKALGTLSSPSKINFESLLMTDDVKLFPYVLFNRAEAHVRLGNQKDALRDFRAFLFITPNHPQVGLVYFRIAELLERVGAPREKIENTWRECQFKVPGTLGGELCKSRDAAKKLSHSDRRLWPRLISEIEAPLRRDLNILAEAGIAKNDLQHFIACVLADAFFENDEPGQAYLRLLPFQNLESKPRVRGLYVEYLMTSFTGKLRRHLSKGEYKDLIKEYELAKRTFLVAANRPEHLWSLSAAHANLVAWARADEILLDAEKWKEKINRVEKRKYDPTVQDWNYLKARILVNNYVEKQLKADVVEKAIALLDRSYPESLRLELQFLELISSQDSERKIKTWNDLKTLVRINENEVKNFSQLLKTLERHNQRLLLLEEYVGAWFVEKRKKVETAKPTATLLYELFDARRSSKQLDSALVVINYLLEQDKSFIGAQLTLSQLFYERGQLFRGLQKIDDARQSFEQSQRDSPESLWGKLSASELRDLRL